MRIDAHVPDLMDRSKVAAAYPDARFVSIVELAESPADLILVDLRQPAVLEAIGLPAGRTIGFASHVDDELIAAALAAGCDEVLPRSIFFRRLGTGF